MPGNGATVMPGSMGESNPREREYELKYTAELGKGYEKLRSIAVRDGFDEWRLDDRWLHKLVGREVSKHFG